MAPHPDDEILGCGGTLFKRKKEGGEVAWLIVTGISEEGGWPAQRVTKREGEIKRVAELVGFARVFNLRLPAAELDRLGMSELVLRFSRVFQEFLPEEVFLPNRGDAHTDHRTVFDAAAACTKWFRYPSVKRVLAYETISETEFGLDPNAVFQPDWFIDITEFLEQKIEAMSVYESETGGFPFPRSNEAIRALAAVRGATCGFPAAEAFRLLRERR